MTNMTVSDALFPPALITKFFLEIQGIGKFAGKRKASNVTTWMAHGEIKREMKIAV
jgi:hypothetical protein